MRDAGAGGCGCEQDGARGGVLVDELPRRGERVLKGRACRERSSTERSERGQQRAAPSVRREAKRAGVEGEAARDGDADEDDERGDCGGGEETSGCAA